MLRRGAQDGVILLHGLGRTSASMAWLAKHLAAAGYRTLNLDYPSRSRDLAGLAGYVWARASAWSDGIEGSVHVVTHSMGGLVATAVAGLHRPKRLGRIVMLAPPNGGSEIADLLSATFVYRALFGPAGAQLGTRRDDATRSLLALDPGCDIGVIAGTRALDPLGWLILPKPNDGKVSVERTRLAGMADMIVLPATHTLITRHPAALRATLAFLRDGRFGRA